MDRVKLFYFDLLRRGVPKAIIGALIAAGGVTVVLLALVSFIVIVKALPEELINVLFSVLGLVGVGAFGAWVGRDILPDDPRKTKAQEDDSADE